MWLYDLLASPIGWALAGYAACYAAACAIWPFTNCRRCGGTGKHRSPSGHAFRRCRKCKGTGWRVRAGRRAWNRMRAEHDSGTTTSRGRRENRP